MQNIFSQFCLLYTWSKNMEFLDMMFNCAQSIYVLLGFFLVCLQIWRFLHSFVNKSELQGGGFLVSLFYQVLIKTQMLPPCFLSSIITKKHRVTGWQLLIEFCSVVMGNNQGVVSTKEMGIWFDPIESRGIRSPSMFLFAVSSCWYGSNCLLESLSRCKD